MKIGILASPDKQTIWESKQIAASYSWVQDSTAHENYDVFIDLDFDDHCHRINSYATNIQTIFLLSAVKTTIEASLFSRKIPFNTNLKILGINALPTMLERNTLECCNPFELDAMLIQTLASTLGYDQIENVGSRVGMVTPRIVCMIINEAYFTLQEGTATKFDIDQAMRLGTNYPKGPFEWCQQMGLKNVYEILESLYQDTHDERYKICSLLKQDYLRLS